MTSSNGSSISLSKIADFCLSCGSSHSSSENHVYDYCDESSLDEAIICDVCYQPFVQPLDLKCGHTFCALCIEPHLSEKKNCPICREPMHATYDVWKSSIVVHKICGALTVYCPFRACRIQLERDQLSSHLQQSCKHYTEYLEKYIIPNSAGAPKPKQRTNIPKSIKDEIIVEINLSKPKPVPSQPPSSVVWGIRFIGGKDTPISNIMVQDGQNCEYLDSSEILLPGDQIVSINNTSLPEGSVNHESFKQLLGSGSATKLNLRVRRRQKHYKNPLVATIREITVHKRAVGESMGMRLLVDTEYGHGIFVSKIVPGKLISQDGRLQVNDRILEINKVDLRAATRPEEAIAALKKQDRKIMFKFMKCPNEIHSINDPSTPHLKSNKSGQRKPYLDAKYVEKMIVLSDQAGQRIGLSLAGGVTDRFRLPCFIQGIVPQSVAHLDGRLKPGDFLVSCNGENLLERSLAEVTSILKRHAQGHIFRISLTVLELEHYDGMRVDRLTYRNLAHYRPSWKTWLLTPSSCLRYECIRLVSDESLGYGLDFCGGWDSVKGNKSVFIADVQKGSPASLKLLPGYEVISFNGHASCTMTIMQINRMLKINDRIDLQYIAWPATLL